MSENIFEVFYKAALSLLTALFCAFQLPSCGILEQTQTTAEEETRFEKDGEVTYASGTEAEHRAEDETTGCEYADNELIVQLAVDLSEEEAQEFAEENGAELVGYISLTGTCQWRLPEIYDLDGLYACAEELESRDEIESVYVNYFSEYQADSMPSKESDKWEKETYHWGYTDVHADAVWDYIDDMKDPINMGVLDMSFLKSSDLDYRIVKNGKTDGDYKEYAKHGTNVSAIMSAVSNNNKGISGVYPDPTGRGEVYAYSATDENGTSRSAVQLLNDIAAMILKDTRVINISLARGSDSEIFARYQSYEDGLWNRYRYIPEGYRDFVEEAELWETYLSRMIDGGYEFLIVTGAGNASNHEKGDGDGNRYRYNDLIYEPVVKPEFNSPWLFIENEKVKERILCVGAYGQSGRVAKFSNMGDRTDILAPGVEIYSVGANEKDILWISGEWMCFSGTSQAAPYVSGAIACIWSLDKNMTASAVRGLLLDSGWEIVDTDIGLTKPVLNLEFSMRKAKEYVDWKHGETENEPETEADSVGVPVTIHAVMEENGKNKKISDAVVSIIDHNGNMLYCEEPLLGTGAEFYLPEGSYTVTLAAEKCVPVTVENLNTQYDYPGGTNRNSIFRGWKSSVEWTFTLEQGIPVLITATDADEDEDGYDLANAVATITDENGHILYQQDGSIVNMTSRKVYLADGSYTVTMEGEHYETVTCENLSPRKNYLQGKEMDTVLKKDDTTRWAFIMEPSELDYTSQFTDYLENTLIPQYGVMPTAEKSLQSYNPGYGHGSTIWLGKDDFDGLLAYRIADFDGDHATEMLLIRGEGGTIGENDAYEKIGDSKYRYDSVSMNMEMYEYQDGEVLCQDNRIFYPSGWYQVTYNETQTGFFTFERDGKTLIAADCYFEMNDHITTLDLFFYDGSYFQYERGFCRYRHYNAETLYTAESEPAELTFAPYTDLSADGWSVTADYREEDDTKEMDDAKIRQIDEAYANGLSAYGLTADDARLDFDYSSGENWDATTGDVYADEAGSLDVIGSVSTCYNTSGSISFHLFREDPTGSLDAYR